MGASHEHFRIGASVGRTHRWGLHTPSHIMFDRPRGLRGQAFVSPCSKEQDALYSPLLLPAEGNGCSAWRPHSNGKFTSGSSYRTAAENFVGRDPR